MNRVRIKICGITNLADAVHAAELGADAIGLNFHPRSPRCIDRREIAPILRALPPFVAAVGVFVEQSLNEAFRIAESFDIGAIQRHGDEHVPTDQFPIRLIEAFRVGGAADLKRILQYVEQARVLGLSPDAILIDGSAPGQFGGTGQTAPWRLLAGFDPGVPLILAGGLTPDNVAEAIGIVRPYAVDVASGVESAPGRKDIEKMRRFIDNARSA